MFIKRIIHKIIKNAFSDIYTSILGGVAGSNDVIQGIANKDIHQILCGLSLIILGLITKSN